MRRLLQGSLGVVTLTWACTSQTTSDEELLGHFGLHAAMSARDCQLDAGFSMNFDFDATLSRKKDGSKATLTLSGVSRDASFDGQVFTSVGEAKRVFTDCAGCASTSVRETLTLALFSVSQMRAIDRGDEWDGGLCPPHPLDGGVPAPNPDAGIIGPATTETGFDAVLACGAIHTEVAADAPDDAGTCPDICRACSSDYVVAGSRR